MFVIVCVVLSCVGRCLFDGLITHPKESYPVSKQIKKPPVYEGAKGPYKDRKTSKNVKFSWVRLR
jgi:hypothetical protein